MVASCPVIGPTTETVMSSANATGALIIRPKMAALKILIFFMAIELLHSRAAPGRASSREAGQFHPSLGLSRRIGATRLGLRALIHAKSHASLVPAGRGFFCLSGGFPAPPRREPQRSLPCLPCHDPKNGYFSGS